MKRIIALLLTLVMVLGLCACGAKEEPTPEKPTEGTEAPAETPADVPVVKVGALYPFSGGSAAAGPEAQFIIDMVIDQYNADGGLKNLGGAQIEIIFGDTQADPQAALTEFERLVNVEGVTCLLGGYNTAVANTLSQYVIAAEVPMLMTSAAGNDAFAVDNRYVYHANSCSGNDLPTSTKITEFQNQLCGYPRTSLVIYDSADYGAQVWQDKQIVAEQLGNTVVGIPVIAGAADYSAEIAKIKEYEGVAAYSEPTLVMDDAIRLMKQMYEKGVAMPVFAAGGGYVQGDFIQQCGDAAEYVFSTGWFFDDLKYAAYDPDWACEVSDAFAAEFGYPLSENASTVWTGVWALIDALERTTANDPEAIVTALEETDIKGEHPALLFTLADHIKYEDGLIEGTDVVVYNQNRYDNSVAWACIMDGAYRIVWPEEFANPDYPLPWPIPAVSER